MRTSHLRVAAGALVIVIVGVTGCSKKEESDKKPATQVVAKVGAEEISVHQLNAVLARLPGVNEQNLPDAKWEVLGRLVDQQIAVNKAREARLDRKPEVVMAMENAKLEILARAYLQELGAAQVKPAPDEVRKYYAAHPELFAERRVFNLQEIIAPRDEELLSALKSQVASARSMEDVAAWLKTRSVDFKTSGGVRTAEQLPMDALRRIHALKDGQMDVLSGEDTYTVVRIGASRRLPVSETQAFPAIQTFLTNQRASETIQREMKALRDATEIVYLGEFVGGPPSKPAVETTIPAPLATPTAKSGGAEKNTKP